MKSFSRKFTAIILVLILILSATVLGGCYFVRSGTVKQIQGTYILTLYSGNEDYIARDGMTLLMVLDGQGSGYYAYKDNDTDPFIAGLRYTMEADAEESGKYSYINVDFGNGDEAHHLAVNADLTSTKFNSQQPVWKGNLFAGDLAIDYYVNVNFEKVDKATDLSYIREDFSTATVFDYGTRRVGGTYHMFGDTVQLIPNDYSSNAPSPFVYFYVDIDMHTSRATVWYMLRADEKSVKKTVTVSVTNDGEIKIKLGDTDTVANFGGSSSSFYIPFETTIDNDPAPATATAYIPLYRDGDMEHSYIEELIVADIARYRESKQPTDDGADKAE